MLERESCGLEMLEREMMPVRVVSGKTNKQTNKKNRKITIKNRSKKEGNLKG